MVEALKPEARGLAKAGLKQTLSPQFQRGDRVRVRRLIFWAAPANASVFVIWGGIPGILLPQQIALLGAGDKVAHFAIVSTVAGIVALVTQPIAGLLSDRTRSRFGRRTPWIVTGAVASGLTLIGLGLASTLIGIAVAWTVLHMAINVLQSPFSAVLPDRIPEQRRGVFSALAGVGMTGGGLAGQVLGSLFFGSLKAGYIAFAAIVIVGMVLFVLANPDESSVGVVRDRFNLRVFVGSFWISPVRYPDFFWAFLSRLLLFTGYYCVTGFQLYVLTDHLHLSHPAAVIPGLAAVGISMTVIATLTFGPLSDRIGRRKPFVLVAALVVGSAWVFPWLSPTLEMWTFAVGMSGFGFGVYQAVDMALVSQVLPNASTYGKDLGIINLSAHMPQTLAPAVAGVVVLAAGFTGLFPVAIVMGLLGGMAILPVRSVH